MKRHSSNNSSKHDKQHFQRNRLDNDRNFNDDRYWTGNQYGNAKDSDWANGSRYDPKYDDIYIPPNQNSTPVHSSGMSTYGKTFWGDRTIGNDPYSSDMYGMETPHSPKNRPDFEPSHFGKGPKGYRRSDERIKEEVCEMLSRDERIDASDIEVDVDDACVILNGFVENRNMRHEAERLVESISGVEDVRNDIKIKKPASPSSWKNKERDYRGNDYRD